MADTSTHPHAVVPQHYRRVEELATRSGATIHVRIGDAADHAQLVDFFTRVSREDRSFRFGDADTEASAAEIAPMLASDGVVTFLAFDAEDRLVACASLFDQPDGQTAEVSLTVAEGEKGKGISWTLLEHVIAHAKERGLRRVVSRESGEERAAINLEREMGFIPRLLRAGPVEIGLSKAIDPD